MDEFPRNPRYYKIRREAEARRRQQMILGLSVLALMIAVFAAFVRLSPSTPASPSVLPAEMTAQAETATPVVPTAATDAVTDALAVGAAGSVALQATPTPAFDPANALFDPHRFSYEPDFYVPEIQAFLDAQPGPLKGVRFQVGDQSHSAAEVFVNLGSLYSLNPKILLAMLEEQSQLLSTEQPSTEQMTWAMGYRGEGGNRQGLLEQLRWGATELRRSVRDYAILPPDTLPEFVFEDDTRQPPPAGISLPEYALSRTLAATTTPDRLSDKRNAFLETYTRLFGDPSQPPTDWPPVAEPFLTSPLEKPTRVTSFFDHDTPFLLQNGSLVSFWGQTETALSYDGHTGWDYALRPPDPIFAAAEGTVVFAGNSDDGCFTPARAVIIDHANGYRTLYWHLSEVHMETGQMVTRGMQVGIAGATGCAFGPHLHFQVQYLGRDVDPYGWCGTTPDPWQYNPAGQVSVWLWADMLSPCGTPPNNVIVVDDTSPGFARSGDWQTSTLGYGGTALFAATSFSDDSQPWRARSLDTPAVAVWQPELPAAGRYHVLAYVPYILNGLDDSNTVRYYVRYRDGETEISVDGESHANSWADLGIYEFDPADTPLVSVSTLAGDEGRGAWADAVVWIPVP